MTADGLSTGLFVLGEDKALEVAEKENIPVYLIMKTEQGFETKMSSAFKKLLANNGIIMQTLFFTLIAFVAIIVLMSVGFYL